MHAGRLYAGERDKVGEELFKFVGCAEPNIDGARTCVVALASVDGRAADT